MLHDASGAIATPIPHVVPGPTGKSSGSRPFSRAALKVSVSMPVLVTVSVCGAESVPIRCVSKVS